jgi:methyl-accepting chemotaxis protein
MRQQSILINSIIVLLFPIAFASYFLSMLNDTVWDEAILIAFCFLLLVVLLILRSQIFVPIQALNHKVWKKDKKADQTFDGLQKEFERLTKVISNATAAVHQLKNGNFAEMSTSEDLEGDGLMELINDLRIELNVIKRTDDQRKWVAEGMNKFVDVLKAEYPDEKSFYDCLISNIVRYMDANQGGLFVVKDEGDRHISLVSCYAYDRKKHLDKRIEIGQGVIGQAYLEGATILLRKVPEQYVSITSGLGHATPNSLMIVPFKVNDVVECLVELASFNQFEKYQIDFIEKLGESIAAAVANRRSVEKTKLLLKDTQLITEQLRAQEEEMRQNMEELTATQEEMLRKEKELQRLLDQSNVQQLQLQNTINEIEHLKEKNQQESSRMLAIQEKYKTDIIEVLNQIPAKIFLKDEKGFMVLCNKTVADGYNISVEELLGTHDRDHFDHEQVKVWEQQEREIVTKGRKTFLQEERFHEKVRYLQTTKLPFYIRHLDQKGIMGFQFDITDSLGAERIEKELRDEIARLTTA